TWSLQPSQTAHIYPQRRSLRIPISKDKDFPRTNSMPDGAGKIKVPASENEHTGEED
ncbi:hypothetical protein BG015_003290, partial [Linnemannia schmuckeri]